MAHNLPALRNREALGVLTAQVVCVWLLTDAQRAKHRNRGRVVEGEGRDRLIAAGLLGTGAFGHRV